MKQKPTILLDKHLAKVGGRTLFARHGVLVETNSFPAHLLAKANVLIIRTKTKIDADLLKLAPHLSFVGSASAGFDHLDIASLQKHQVQFSYAAGSNAHAVVDYVLSAFATANRLEDLLRGRQSLGIIGFGHIGKHLADRLNSLARLLKGEQRILVYDPALSREEIEQRNHNAICVTTASLKQVLAADCISLHCSLTPPTRNAPGSAGMLDANMLCQLKQHQILINSARADVLDKAAWEDIVKDSRNIKATLVFDVWHKKTSRSLVSHCFLATPHVAGYSHTGKQTALYSVYEDFCRHFNFNVDLSQQLNGDVAAAQDSVRDAVPPLQPQAGESMGSFIKRLVLMNYDIVRDSLHTKRAVHLAAEPGEALTRLRNNYIFRHRVRDMI